MEVAGLLPQPLMGSLDSSCKARQASMSIYLSSTCFHALKSAAAKEATSNTYFRSQHKASQVKDSLVTIPTELCPRSSAGRDQRPISAISLIRLIT